MAKFNVGDVVKYRDGTEAARLYNVDGVRGTISKVSENRYIYHEGRGTAIRDADDLYNDYALELVAAAPVASPIREVTKREFFSGAYGIVNVSCVDKPMLLPKSRGYTPQEIRNAAQTLIEIADYLDENAKDAA